MVNQGLRYFFYHFLFLTDSFNILLHSTYLGQASLQSDLPIFIHLILSTPCEMGIVIIPILQIGRSSATKKLSGSEWQSQGSNPAKLALRSDAFCAC